MAKMAAAAGTASSKASSPSSAGSTHLSLKEEDVVKLACEFMHNRQLNISQVTLERESGVINGSFSDDLLFLRQLILDGQWEDTIEFIQPLASLPSFQYKTFQYTILRAKFIELLCIKSEAPIAAPETAVDTVVEVLKEIEAVAPSKEQYSNLCLLLTMNKLTEHPDYRAWNPSKGRVQCFKEVLPLVHDLLGGPGEQKRLAAATGDLSALGLDGDGVGVTDAAVASNDRLLQLLIKGILYESCVDYCQAKATGAKSDNRIEFTRLLDRSDFSDSDLSLLSWLQSIPSETFACPFEQRSLNVDVERLSAPALETSWTEHMMIKPIKPNIFPHSAMPNTRPKATDIMTKSLSVSIAGGANRSLSASVSGGAPAPAAPAAASNSATASSQPSNTVSDMSKSLAAFHLSGSGGRKPSNNPMEASVDQLFREETARGRQNNRHENGAQKQLASEYHQQKVIEHSNPVLPQPPHPPHVGQPMDPSAGAPLSHGVGGGGVVKRNTAAAAAAASGVPSAAAAPGGPPRFLPICTLEDIQAIRCAEFHPGGRIFAVGSNSKTLRICQYPGHQQQRAILEDNRPAQTHVLSKRTRHHKGSIYCLSWNSSGSLIATGSNDKTVKLMAFNPDVADAESADETELSMHDGTVRDLVFMGDDQTLVSGGAGDCKLYVTDSATGQTLGGMVGHAGHVLAVCTWAAAGNAMLVSGAQDKTARFWDLRTRGCVSALPFQSAVAAVTVDPSGRLMVTGHEDATCALYDVRGGRVVQTFKPHTQDVRSVRFSPNAFYLLSGGYDNRLVLTDLQGDLSQPLPTVVVAAHQDKVISGRWHTTDFSFVSTSADKACTLWGLPPL